MKNKSPKVSIIIPTYNQEGYISQTIESALAQDYLNLEIILSDDNSKDNTPNIIKKYLKDKRFKYFRNKKNLGRVGNYHKALYNYATGDYALVLDGDDYLLDKSYINEAMRLIQKEGLILVFAKQNVKIEKSNKIILDRMNNRLPKVIDGNWLFLHYPNCFSIPHLSSLYNRKYAMKIGYYNKNILSSDWESVLRLMINKKVGFINKSIGIWRKHSTNESKSLDLNKIMKNIEYIKGPYEFCSNKKIFDKKVLDEWRSKMLKRFFIKNLIRFQLLRDGNLHKDLIKEIKNYDKRIYDSINKDLRLIFMKNILRNKFLTKFIFKYIIKNESYLEDLK